MKRPFLFSLPVILALGFLSVPAQAQSSNGDDKPSTTQTAAEKARKQAATEEAETLCRSIKDQDKFYECLDLYFLDAGKFQAYLEQHGVSKPTKSGH
jgi:hypothetical protein